MTQLYDVAVIGCGSTGLATAYYLARQHGINNIVLIDAGAPMAFTSAQSGENYRNWWPHPTMVDFTNRSIDLMEAIAVETDNRINMTRRGYALVTRDNDISELLEQLQFGLGDDASTSIRIHEKADANNYEPPTSADWAAAPTGVDILRNQQLIQNTFPSYDKDVQTVIHIRRGGDISAQQMGMHMLEFVKEQGASRVTATVIGIEIGSTYTVNIKTPNGSESIRTRKIVNAAGPFANSIARMLGTTLPIHNTFQQKIAFEDIASTIPRDLPFSIDLDAQQIDWSADEHETLHEDDDFRWLTELMPGAIHCRPDGGDNGTWVKLGWAYNQTPDLATRELPLDDHFPEVVLRGAAKLNPSLKQYYDQLPRKRHHYGGWYTLTDENWPLIGPISTDNQLNGVFMNCALSGFGTMAACAGGELCAAWVVGAELPDYAPAFSLERYADVSLMEQLASSNKGIL